MADVGLRKKRGNCQRNLQINKAIDGFTELKINHIWAKSQQLKGYSHY